VSARILIVDDEPFNVDYLEQELESLGFVTETADDGLDALERVAAAPPDLVLLDVMMPRMDGISALRALKGDPETRLIPVVLMTALNAVEDRVRGIEAGADDFLSKPVDDRELLARIRTALSQKRAIDETVAELQSTSAQLERHGSRERDVAVLVADWRPRDANVPEPAVGFVARRHRAAAVARIRAAGGAPSERETGRLVAAFEGADAHTRARAAVKVALAVVDEEAPAGVIASLGVTTGRARVGPVRIADAGEPRWVYDVDGRPVARASELARGATATGVLVAEDVARLVADRFALQPAGDGTFRVLDEPDGDARLLRPPAGRPIRTILVTDVVGSTRILERLGDEEWSRLASEHERATTAELARFGGDLINTTGDGYIASFESAAAAVRCALAVMERLAAHGLRLRAGVHAGELATGTGRATGIALNAASRIAARANPAEVLVSATARDLAAGSGLAFSDRGEHVLEGIAEPRRLFAAAEQRGAAAPPVSEPSAAAAFPARLTAREVDVLRLVAVGLSDAEAAERLFVSVRTVHAHLRSIYRKAGVHSRAAAGRFAEENGLL
jgi:DNA-binding NarL/FixJ family response regulator